jgi:hypothetical protein
LHWPGTIENNQTGRLRCHISIKIKCIFSWNKDLLCVFSPHGSTSDPQSGGNTYEEDRLCGDHSLRVYNCSPCPDNTGSIWGWKYTCGCSPQTPKNPIAPVEGANSFTEAQAKDRIAEAGYTDVKDLKLDGKGIWRASGMKDGKAVSIALDYQGDIVAK